MTRKILNKPKLIIGDLINILRYYSNIKWGLSDVEKGTITVRNRTYILLGKKMLNIIVLTLSI